jgi:hypothetical protein
MALALNVYKTITSTATTSPVGIYTASHTPPQGPTRHRIISR